MSDSSNNEQTKIAHQLEQLNNKNLDDTLTQQSHNHLEVQTHHIINNTDTLRSTASTLGRRKTDLESTLNRLYSFLLVEYFWVFLVLGVIISISMTAFGFMKQPLPNFLDPTRGFGARGEGTLTSQLIVLKNVYIELQKYEGYIIELYENVTRENRSTYDVDQEKAKEITRMTTTLPNDNNYDDPGYDYEDPNKNKDYDKDDGQTNDQPNDGGIVEDESNDYIEPEPNSGTGQNDVVPDAKNTTENESNQQNEKKTEEEIAGIAKHILENNITIDDTRSPRQLLEEVIYKEYTVKQLVDLLPDEKNTSQSNIAFRSIENCDYSLDLDKNFEFYFETSENHDIDGDKNENISSISKNLLNITRLRSLCEWDTKILNMISTTEKPCYFSLPFAIATIANKTNCLDLNETDITTFVNTLNKCEEIYKTGILYEAVEEQREKSRLAQIMNKKNLRSLFLRLPIIQENICFKHHLIYLINEFIIDSKFTLERVKVNRNRFITNTSDDAYAETTSKYLVEHASLWVMNELPIIVNKTNKTIAAPKLYDQDRAFDFYMKHFYRDAHDDSITKIVGINLIGIRQAAAMRLISQDMLLVAVAISLICVVTVLYLRSITIAVVVNISVAFSVGVAFFAYRIVFKLDLFPFINMMAAFLLIGIACDNVYVLFDAWYSEKTHVLLHDYIKSKLNRDSNNKLILDLDPHLGHIKMFMDPKKPSESNEPTKNDDSIVEKEKKAFIDIENTASTSKPETQHQISLHDNGGEITHANDIHTLEMNPVYVRHAPLTQQQMIRVMGGTLRHAASSIFVTSFTTAAAFLTNMTTKLPYVQLFGLFTGTCILIYFLMVITMIAAFVILYERYINRFSCKLPSGTNKIRVCFDEIMKRFTSLNNKIIGHFLPKTLIKLRLLFFLLFLLIGIAGMLTVFYKPKLKPPTNWRYQFFKSNNLLEVFEFNLRDKFYSYINAEKRNLTNPEIYFIFGILAKDTGRVFDPDDDGHLLYDNNFEFLSEASQTFIDKFITQHLASRTDLFIADELVSEWEAYLNYMKLFCFSDTGMARLKIPVPPQLLSKCRDEMQGLLVNSSIENFHNLMAIFPRRIVFIPKGKSITGILLRVNANYSFVDYERVSEYYSKLKEFHTDVVENSAPPGYNTGWFVSIAFALYDLQFQLMKGTYESLILSMVIALVVLLLTSGNVFIAFYAIITISFTIAITIAVFVLLGWNLSVLESVVIIMSVGLSVDFSCHYGVAYIQAEINEQELARKQQKYNAQEITKSSTNKNKKSSKKVNNKMRNLIQKYQNGNQERFMRVQDTFKRVGSAVLMAAFTTFLAGMSMYPSNLTSFSKMGQFLMLVMFTSYLYATFFFVPLCSLFGPTENFGDIKLKLLIEKINRRMRECCKLDECEEDEKKKLKKLQNHHLKAAASTGDAAVTTTTKIDNADDRQTYKTLLEKSINTDNALLNDSTTKQAKDVKRTNI